MLSIHNLKRSLLVSLLDPEAGRERYEEERGISIEVRPPGSTASSRPCRNLIQLTSQILIDDWSIDPFEVENLTNQTNIRNKSLPLLFQLWPTWLMSYLIVFVLINSCYRPVTVSMTVSFWFEADHPRELRAILYDGRERPRDLTTEDLQARFKLEPFQHTW